MEEKLLIKKIRKIANKEFEKELKQKLSQDILNYLILNNYLKQKISNKIKLQLISKRNFLKFSIQKKFELFEKN